MTKTIMVDGIACEMTDTAAQVVQRALAQSHDAAEKSAAELEKEKKAREEEKKSSDAAAADAKKANDTKDGEIAALKKQVEDGKMTPEKIDALVKDRAAVIDRAVSLLGDKIKIEGRSDAEIRRDVVSAKLGDAAKGMSDDAIAGAFGALTHDAKTTTTGATSHSPGFAGFARAVGAPVHNSMDAREEAFAARSKYLKDAYKNPAPAAS